MKGDAVDTVEHPTCSGKSVVHIQGPPKNWETNLRWRVSIANNAGPSKLPRSIMPSARTSMITLTLTLCCSSPAFAQAQRVEPKTAEAVVQADDAWGDAETRGDGDYLEHLLSPAYVSIGITTRETIIAHARARGASAAYAEQAATWKAAHPSRADVSIAGDTAVLMWKTTGANGELVRSCDIFVYRGGRWRALYSQHSSAS